MASVADRLRQDTHDRVARLSVAERIELALSLGRDDLSLFMRVSGRSHDEALRAFRAQRTRGRTSSCAAPEQ
jgi:predicted alpha/beta-hydrolase family hydrolase